MGTLLSLRTRHPALHTGIIAALFVLLLTLLLILTPHPPTKAPDPAPAAENTDLDTAAIDIIIQDARKSWQAPGVAVGIVRDDRVIYLKGFGVRELGKDAPMTPDTLVPIASCTKAFTTTALAMLADEGKLSWDDPVRKHVPQFHLADPLADEQVILRDLLTHRTGLASNDFLWYRSPWDRAEVVRRIGLVKPKHGFRTTFEYQSTMFTVAGMAVEAESGQPWEDFVQARILNPLGMKHTVFTTPEALRNSDRASPHRKDDEGNVKVIPFYSMEKPEASGSIHSSARDLTQWLRFHLNDGTLDGKRLVSADNLEETHSPQMIIPLEGQAKALNPDTFQMRYGMGWVIQDYRGQLLVSHAGQVDGFRTHLTLVPRARLGIVLLNNLDRSQLNVAISNTILDRLLGLPKRDWNTFIQEQLAKSAEEGRKRYQAWLDERHPNTTPSLPLTDYAGVYRDPAYGEARLTVEDDTLIWQWSTFKSPLVHYHYDTFVIRNEVIGFPQLVFKLDGDGKVSSFRVAHPLEVDFRRD